MVNQVVGCLKFEHKFIHDVWLPVAGGGDDDFGLVADDCYKEERDKYGCERLKKKWW